MSIIQSIRDKGAWVIGGVIALALIAFILQDGSRQGSILSSSSSVGSVNGVAIDKQEFLTKLDNATKNNGSQRDAMQNQIFEQEVSKILLEEEFEKVGVACSDKELNEEMFKPSSQLVQQFKNPETQQPDVEKAKEWYKDYKKNPKEEVKQFLFETINQTKLVTKYNKYNSLLNGAAYAPKWLIDKQQNDNNAFASVSYVAVPYSAIPDSTLKVSDDEIVAYAKKHHRLYDKTDETRSISYISFNAIPNAADTNNAKEKIMQKAAAFASETNMQNFFARNTSEIPYKNTYIPASKVQGAMKDSLLKLPVGSTYGPYIDGSNYVIAKLVSTRSIADSVRARHILIKTSMQDPQTGQLSEMGNDSAAKHTLDTVVMKLNSGSGFDSLCAKYSEDGSAKTGGDLKYFAAGQMVDEFNEFCFTNGVGAKGIVKTQFGFHYIEVTGTKGNVNGYKVAYYTSPIVLSTETDLAIKNEAKKFATSIKDKKQFDDEVAKLKKQPITADNIKKNDYQVGMLQSCSPLVKWVYDNKTEAITDEPLHIGTKYVVAVVTEINKPGLPGAASLKSQVENVVKNEKKAKQIIAKFKGTSLEDMAKNVGYNSTVTKLDTFLISNPFAPIVNNDNRFTGAALNATNKGKISEPIAGLNSVFVIRTENVGAKPTTAPQDPMMIKGAINNTIKALSGRVVNELLRKAAKIDDNRGEMQ